MLDSAVRLDDPPEAPASPPLRAVAAQPAAPQAAAAAPERAAPRLVTPRYRFDHALELRRELGIGHVLAQVLVRRGLADPAAARAFLDAREIYAPGRFAGMAGAVDLILAHLAAGSRIVVHGDYDVDGVCATAIAIRALRSLEAAPGWFIPSRTVDGYGLSEATVARLAARGTDLLLTVDCGITAVEEVAAARAAGMDVVISDHHAPRSDGRLPDAAIVHPVLGGYPCAELCGTAVSHKLAQALGAPSVQDGGDMDLVALATVADLVPLTGENRRLVREGLRALAATTKPGLRALMAVARVDPSAIDTAALGFRLAPRINAAGRMRRADAGLELLLTEDTARAREIALELDAVNAERRAVEERITWEAERLVAERGDRPGYVLAAEGWHPGVIGIVASRIVERHHRPAVLLSIGEDGIATGSGRSIPGFDLLGALHATAEHLGRYGGHRAAAGLSIERDQIGPFAAAFEAHAAAVLAPEDLVASETVDAVLSGSQLDLALVAELEMLEPCGMGNPAPRLLVPGARFTDVRPMGDGRHARFTIRSGAGHARAVAFGCDGRPSGGPEEAVDATLRLERNVWNGAVEPRAVLRHARPCERGAIEVIGETDGYLARAFAELDRPLATPRDAAQSHAGHRLDRRAESPLAVLADVVATGAPVLAVCGDVPRRLAGLRARTGGFALTSHAALADQPGLVSRFAHLVVLDPPAEPAAMARLVAPHTHWAWGSAELRFAEQMHELEYDLRERLAGMYRALRALGAAAGEGLEELLRWSGGVSAGTGLPARVAGRLVRVLAELGLVSCERATPALVLVAARPTQLERSAAFQEYTRRLEEGRRYLSDLNRPPNAR